MCSNHKLTSWTLCAIISALICVTLGLACTIFLYQSGYFYNNNDNHHNNNKDLKVREPDNFFYYYHYIANIYR